MGFLSSIFGGNSVQTPSNTAQAQQNFNDTQGALGQQQAFVQALMGVNGLGNQQNVYNQLQGVANGTGPNPAQAMLNNATGQNIAQQASLMGSQRGVNQNPGLLARQAAMQGANLQQQAVGQGAGLQAQQSLNALGALGDISGQQIAEQQGGLGALNQAAQGERGQTLNSIAGQNSAATGIANGSGGNVLSGVGGAIGTGVGKVLGGLFAEGGQVGANTPGSMQSFAGQHLMGMAHGSKVPGKPEVKGDSYKNDKVPAMLSPGEIVVPRSHAADPKKAAAFAAAVAMRSRNKHEK